MKRRQLALSAVREATRVRAQLNLSPADTLCPYDAALELGLVVQFLSVPSLEGMYNAGEVPTIVIGSERPAGRRRFTCGHELGHHVYGHGTRFDQLNGTSDSTEEYLADSFSAAFLMPKTVIDAALTRRGWARRLLTEEMLFILAQDIGVGYTTLIRHLSIVLRYLTFAQATKLEARKLPAIRKALAGFDVPRDVFIVDDAWGTRPVELEVGDIIIAPSGASLQESTKVILAETSPILHFVAAQTGKTTLMLPSRRRVPIRVSKEDYAGRAQYRHLEEPDDDE